MTAPAVEQRNSPHYGVVFAVLVIFTALETTTAYLPNLSGGLKVGILAFLAVVKIGLVLLYFMHLKFDSAIFTLPFALGVVLLLPLLLIAGLAMAQTPISAEAVGLNATGQVIDVTEFSYHLKTPTTAQAGPVTFHVVNGASGVLHEFIIVQTDDPAAELPLDDNGRVAEDEINIVTAADDISPSTSRNVNVNLAPGHYVLMCNLPGHYLQGMRVDFTVTGTSSQPASTLESPASEPTPTP